MATGSDRVREYLRRLTAQRPPEAIEESMLPSEEHLSPRFTAAAQLSRELLEKRWKLLGHPGEAQAELLDERTLGQLEAYAGSVENFVGTVKLPLGIAGPLRVRGVHARGDFYAPMATSEAALVASYTRGAQAISRAGGCAAAVVSEGVSRVPAFLFDTLAQAGRFVMWLTEHTEPIKAAAEATTRFGRLADLRINLEGNHVYLIFEYTTSDAAGQNMVTLATDAACRWILANSPLPPRAWYIEANLSGDKKSSHQSFQGVRGRKTVAEVVLPAGLLKRRLGVTADQMMQYIAVSALGGVMSGCIGVQGHYANALAALFIACGQDAACVAEASVGITRYEPAPDDGLYACVTLPNLIVGTVGGGTGLPATRACLDLMGLSGAGHANAFAEVCAALVLAGELSITAAIAADEFTEAHRRLARGRSGTPSAGSPPATGDGL